MADVRYRVWEKVLHARMNKYYHQKALQGWRWTNVVVNMVSVFAVGVGIADLGGTRVLPQGATELPHNMLFVVAGIISLGMTTFAVAIDLASLIAKHHVLFDGFGGLEIRAQTLWNRMEGAAERGELVSMDAYQSADELDDEFIRLEAKQSPPYKRLLEWCEKTVLAERISDQNTSDEAARLEPRATTHPKTLAGEIPPPAGPR